jgi:hypothetical protein
MSDQRPAIRKLDAGREHQFLGVGENDGNDSFRTVK